MHSFHVLQVFTVFSTSKDHGQGKGAMCGCILVDFDKIQVINRSAKYKNKYIHRRDSLSLAALSAADKEKLTKIGVVTEVPTGLHYTKSYDACGRFRAVRPVSACRIEG